MPDFSHLPNNQQRRHFARKPTTIVYTRKKKLTLFRKSNSHEYFTLIKQNVKIITEQVFKFNKN